MFAKRDMQYHFITYHYQYEYLLRLEVKIEYCDETTQNEAFVIFFVQNLFEVIF